MEEVKTNLGLITIAYRQGLKMGVVEAAIVLGYLSGHDFSLLTDGKFHLKLHDNQDGENHDEDDPYTIREAIEFCKEINGELLSDAMMEDSPDKETILEFEKDEYILDALLLKAENNVPPVIREYKVAIVESLKRIVSIRAASWAEAEEQARRGWEAGEYVLTAEDFSNVRFNAGRV